MTTAKDIMKQIKDNDVKFVDLRFTDPKGKLQHVTMDVVAVEEDMFADGVMFDGSSIAGWKAINESDMVLMPDPDTRPHGPVLRAVDHGHPLRHPRSGLGRSLQPRPARHRQEGRGLSEGGRHRRHRLCRPGSRILRVRRRQVQGRSLQHRLQARFDRTAVQRRHRLRDRQPRPPSARQGRLFPGAADRQRAGHALRNADRARRNGRARRKAPPRGGRRPARAWRQVRHAGAQRRQDADLQIRRAPGRQRLWQDGDLHAEADLRRQRLGHARPHVDLEGRQADLRRQRICRPVGELPVLHRRRHQARQGDQRLHQPADQLLQAPGAGL